MISPRISERKEEEKDTKKEREREPGEISRNKSAQIPRKCGQKCIGIGEGTRRRDDGNAGNDEAVGHHWI